MLKSIFFFAFIVLIASVYGEVIVLDENNFDSKLSSSPAAFIEFYAPWCGHCKRLAPEYDIVGETFAKYQSKVLVAKVDCDANRDLCQSHGVSGYPTLKWFENGEFSEDYNSGRTADDISDFIAGKTGIRLPRPQTAVKVLKDATFDKEILESGKFALVEFYAPWCGHCKKLAPTYEKLANAFKAEENVVIANFDADAQKQAPSKYGVTGFPTIFFFSPGNSEPEKYSGARDLESLVDFINEKAGTQRLGDGSLHGSAGRLEKFDEIAAKFIDASDDEKNQFIDDAKNLQASLESKQDSFSGKVYLRAMSKILSDGNSYLTNETSRLQRMLDSGAVSASKADQFQIRINILDSFLSN